MTMLKIKNRLRLATFSQQWVMALCTGAISVIALAATTQAETQPIDRPAKIAIIIDDIGYNKSQGLAALDLPGAVTYAVIPQSPNADFLAREAHKRNKELMLHAPMSNVHNHPLGKAGLSGSMSKSAFDEVLNDALASVPHIRGVNNHMGSQLTQMSLPMQWVMGELRKRDLYFIDSRTTPHSIAWTTAQQHNVPSLKRDVFLDNEQSMEQIEQQFQRLTDIAKRRGYAVAIAHPYPVTIKYLHKKLQNLSDQKVQLVPASQLVYQYSPNRHRIQAKM